LASFVIGPLRLRIDRSWETCHWNDINLTEFRIEIKIIITLLPICWDISIPEGNYIVQTCYSAHILHVTSDQ
jgi:hypothetical protein